MDLVDIEIDQAALDRLAADVEYHAGYENDTTHVMCISGVSTSEAPAEFRETALIRASLKPFEEDWDAPGMDAYDAL